MNGIATFLRESKVARFLIPMGIVLIVFSIFMFISDDHNKNYIEAEATVSKVELFREESFDAEGNREPAEYTIFVKYTVNGNDYDTELGVMFEKKIGDKIKELRMKKGVSREELAFRVGVSGSYIGMIERAEYDFKISKLINIAKALNIKMKEIVCVD